MNTNNHQLMNYDTGEYLRTATEEELNESKTAAETDGGAGVITVEIDGTLTDCYVLD